MTTHSEPVDVHPKLSVLRYNRAFSLTTDALHTMCCETGSMRERLQKIDRAFYSFSSTDVPVENGIRDLFSELKTLVTAKNPTWSGEGTIDATLSSTHHTKLKKLAELIWSLHCNFSKFMQGGA